MDKTENKDQPKVEAEEVKAGEATEENKETVPEKTQEELEAEEKLK